MISHPITRCPDARDLYFAWTKFKKGTADYEKACLRYKWHVYGGKCDKCREGLELDGG